MVSKSPAVIYARYSSDNQREESIEGQVRVCKDFAERNNLEVIKVYADRAISGRTDQRPDYQKMMRDAKTRAFRHVLVWKGDRISRDRYDKAYCRKTLKKYGIDIISVTETIPDGAEGILLESLLDGLAEYYSVNLAENTLRGMKENALKCKYNGAPVPFGYVIDNNNNYQLKGEAESSAIQEVFERYARGDKIKTILSYCHRVGVTSSTGTKLSYSTLSNLVTNPIYKGTYRFSDIVVEDGVPAIVSKDLWERANMMKESTKKRNGVATDQIWSLTGKATCGLCGSPIVGDSGTGRSKKYFYYSCLGNKRDKKCDQKSWPKDELEERVCNVLQDVISSDEFRIELTEALKGTIEEWNEQNIQTKPLVDGQLADARKRVRNLTEAIASSGGTTSLIEALKDAELELEALEIEQKRNEINLPEKINPDEVEYFFIYLKEQSEKNADGAKDLLMQALLHHVVVYPDKLEIALNYTLESKRVALLAKDDSCDSSLVRMSLEWLPKDNNIRTIYLNPAWILITCLRTD